MNKRSRGYRARALKKKKDRKKEREKNETRRFISLKWKVINWRNGVGLYLHRISSTHGGLKISLAFIAQHEVTLAEKGT